MTNKSNDSYIFTMQYTVAWWTCLGMAAAQQEWNFYVLCISGAISLPYHHFFIHTWMLPALGAQWPVPCDFACATSLFTLKCRACGRLVFLQPGRFEGRPSRTLPEPLATPGRHLAIPVDWTFISRPRLLALAKAAFWAKKKPSLEVPCALSSFLPAPVQVQWGSVDCRQPRSKNTTPLHRFVSAPRRHTVQK